MRAVRLKTERMVNPLGIDVRHPDLSWICDGGVRQSAYRIIAEELSGKKGAENRKVIWDSGKISSSAMQVRFPEELESRQRIGWKVELWDEKEQTEGWSEEAFFEMALLDRTEWKAQWIDPEEERLSEPYQPASYLKKTFSLDSGMEEIGRARLYITAHGLYEARLNGHRIGDQVLTPGTSEYESRLQYQTYDVTDMLTSGENVLLVFLGNGWYRGSNGITGSRNVFGDDLALLCQMEVDGQVTVVSDDTWQAGQEGPDRSNDMQQGELYDARMEEIEKWHPVRVESSREGTFDFSHLVCSDSVPVREKETFAATWIRTPKGELVADFGQNLAGYTKIRVTAKAGDQIVLTHGETLDRDGNFTVENFQPNGRTPRNLDQKITYICKDGVNEFKPAFSIFGFRYAKVETDIPVENMELTSIAVYSDMEQTGFFVCSDADVNQLFHNALWSQKSNFVDVPTDCPTRERAGWTGDAQVYIPTALYLTDAYPVFRKWLSELRLVQFEDGNLPGVAPVQEPMEGLAVMMAGSAGWGDACVIVPYTLWKVYGDRRILEENYDMMKRWVERCRKLAETSRPETKEKAGEYAGYIIDTGFHWGEWLEPDRQSEDVLRDNIMKGVPEVTTPYFYYSSKLLGEIAGILGKGEDEKIYLELAEKIRTAFNRYVIDNGRIHSDRQCAYVRPIALGLLDPEDERQAAEDLNELVQKMDYHLNTGFLSTPFLCKVLSEHGYADTACRLLLQDTCPGWLYAVKKGATTIWETWDGVREDGTVHDSLNHYSYGAVVGWLFDSVCGIRVSGDQISICPTPGEALTEASAIYDSPLGRIACGWKRETDDIKYHIVIPANGEARVCLPGEKPQVLTAGEYDLQVYKYK